MSEAGVSFRTNIREFNAELRALGGDLQRKTVRAGAGAAAGVFKREAQERAPVLKTPKKKRIAGTLRRSIIAVRSRRGSRAGLERWSVTVKTGGKTKNSYLFGAWYWRWVEKGHLATGRRRIRGGRNTRALARRRWQGRRVPAYPFLEPAFRHGTRAAVEAFEKRIAQRIAQANRKP